MTRNKDPRFFNKTGNMMATIQQGVSTSDTIVAPTGGIIINAIIATNDDAGATAPVMTVEITDSSDTVISKLGKFSLTKEAGTDGSTDPDNIKEKFTFLDIDGAENPILYLAEGEKLKFTVAFSGSGGEIVNVSCFYGILEED